MIENIMNYLYWIGLTIVMLFFMRLFSRIDELVKVTLILKKRERYKQ